MLLTVRRMAVALLAALPLASAVCPPMHITYSSQDKLYYFTKLPQVVKVAGFFTVKTELHILPKVAVQPENLRLTVLNLCNALYQCGANGMRVDIEKHTLIDFNRCKSNIGMAVDTPPDDQGVTTDQDRVNVDQYRANVASMIQNQYNNWIRIRPSQPMQ
ncbi:MAG: hypothetical protein M1826_000773 [Phylliscum demangeonii]|nr:MAG: hypothetical protein M1826_000773 [Phylliscum demangeonii]